MRHGHEGVAAEAEGEVTPNAKLWVFVASAVCAGTIAGHAAYYVAVLGVLP